MEHNEITYKLGRRIAKLRKEKGLSQEEFAEISGKMVNTISKIERGVCDPRLSTFYAAAEALEIDPGVIFSETQYAPVIYSATLERMVKLLQHEDEKTIKAILKITETILALKKD